MKDDKPLVLIVDDDPGARLLARASLEASSLDVIEAEDGAAALALFEEHCPDIVLLDIVMPGMDGFEVCASLRRLPRASDTPIVVMTGLEDVSSINRAYEVGATDFVGKPVNHVVLQQRVRYMLRATQTMKELRDSERRLSRAQRMARVAHWEWNRDSDTFWVSEAFGKLFGGTPRSHEGISGAAEWIHPHDLDRVTEAFTVALEKGSAVSIEHRITLPNGNERVVHHQAEPVDDGQGKPRWAGALQDITESADLRRQLMHADRLTAVGQLAAGVAHEINNPSSFVLANLVLMGEHLDVLNEALCRMHHKTLAAEDEEPLAVDALFAEYRLDHRVQELGDMVSDNLEGMKRIVGIVKDLASFSRVEQEEIENFNINDVVRAACNMTSNEIRHQGLLTVELGTCPPLRGHPGKIGQVLTNLLINAAHAIRCERPDGHEVRVTTSTERGAVKITIEDTGCGIPEANQRHIFDPFFTTKSRNQGTGLGLSLSAEFVRKHGGDIRLVRTSDEGSLFEVTLPRKERRRSTLPNMLAPRRERVAAGRRILVIDDEIPLLRAFKRILSKDNIVITACGGREGLEILENDRHFDAVICDLMMPGVDGIDVFEWLQERDADVAQRLIFCTGGAFTRRAKAFTAEVDVPLIQKPIDWENLTELIDSLRSSPSELRVISP